MEAIKIMQIYLTLKTPDALNDAIERTAEGEFGRSDDPDEEARLDEEFNSLVDKTLKQAEKWFRCGETVKLVIDTEEDTCKVIPVKDW